MSLPALGEVGAAVERLAAGTPRQSDLLAAASIAAIAILCLRDALLDWQDRRRHRKIEALAADR